MFQACMTAVVTAHKKMTLLSLSLCSSPQQRCPWRLPISQSLKSILLYQSIATAHLIEPTEFVTCFPQVFVLAVSPRDMPHSLSLLALLDLSGRALTCTDL